MKDRSIIDIALIASEIVHHMKCKNKGLKGESALKVDFSKAFDKVSWEYLSAIMLKLGFAPQWFTWIHLCLSSVSYTILVNRDPIGPIIPGCGLCQGDPLSPFLYIICVEGLSALPKHAEATGTVHGIQVSLGAPKGSHISFADDIFLFLQANENEFLAMK